MATILNDPEGLTLQPIFASSQDVWELKGLSLEKSLLVLHILEDMVVCVVAWWVENSLFIEFLTVHYDSQDVFQRAKGDLTLSVGGQLSMLRDITIIVQFQLKILIIVSSP